MSEYFRRPANSLRGYTAGGVVHYVIQDEWLDCSLLCVYELMSIDAVDASLEPVNCLFCLCLYVAK